MNGTFQNTTIDNVHNTVGPVDGFMMSVGVFFGPGGSTGTINATINNVTISDVTSANIAAPFASVAFAAGGNANVNTTVNNATITGVRGITEVSGPLTGIKSAAFYSATLGIGSGDVGTAVVNVSNTLLADNLSDGVSSNCMASDITSNFGGSGSGNSVINSLGHNISDDSSCSAFTSQGDQQNINNILSTLGPLQNNGGVVPTRALLPGSPAIASGSSVLGVTTDARGIARPSTCPSVGAFQFEGAVCAASTTSGGSNAGAPNTGIRPSSTLAAIIATVVGLATIGYAFKAKSRSSR